MDSAKKIKFSVPSNWQDDLIPGLPKDAVLDLYGKLAVDFVGGGRASSILYPVSKEKAALHIAAAHKRGFGFNYLLNSTCMDNRELTKYGQGKIIELVDWIVKVGVDSVTVTTPFMLRLIKENFPSLRIDVSVHNNINSVREAKLWDELGADKITLSVLDVSRDFSLLKKIRAAVGCKLQLIANLKCLLGCPFYRYHANLTAHASQSEHLLKGYLIDYCTLRCNFIRISQPVEYIKSNWIRPEDVGHYERLGIDSLKLVGRQMQTKFIHSIVHAYGRRQHDGNLLDLLPSHQKGMVIGGKKFFSLLHKLKFFFRPQYVNIFRLQKARKLFKEEKLYIDNRALDGFLNYFLEGKCNFDCQSCSYCDAIARKALRIDPRYQNRVKTLTGNFLNELYNGKMFSYFINRSAR